LVDLLRGDLFGVAAQDEVNVVPGAINLSEQTLQINRAAGPGRGDDEFHELVTKSQGLQWARSM
jgi:hypothetical protein